MLSGTDCVWLGVKPRGPIRVGKSWWSTVVGTTFGGGYPEGCASASRPPVINFPPKAPRNQVTCNRAERPWSPAQKS